MNAPTRAALLGGCLLSLLVGGCASYYARQLNTEQMENAIRLLEARQGAGCLCISGEATPLASQVRGVMVGVIGTTELEGCAQICLDLQD